MERVLNANLSQIPRNSLAFGKSLRAGGPYIKGVNVDIQTFPLRRNAVLRL